MEWVGGEMACGDAVLRGEILDSGLGLRSLLRLDEFWVVDESVVVLVVRRQDGVDHVDQLLVLKDLGFRDGLSAAGVVVRLVWKRKKLCKNFTISHLAILLFNSPCQ